MAMQFLWSLSAACANGLKCYSWLMGKVDILFDNDQAALLAKRMIETWPGQRLPGFDQGFHLDWTHLYCARNGCWFNNNLIQAFSATLSAKYGASTTIFLPQLHTPAKDKGHRIPPLTLSLVAATNMEWVFMPLNVNASHWTCLALAQELVVRSMTEPYEIIAVHNPIQNDGGNCGLFVCLFFWRRVDKEAPRDHSKTGCLRQPWDLLRSVVDFSDSSKNAE
ncbi:uncharacterized protein PITG_17482 [Phytophthora infestans T30-4]|uniref:Cysteine protease family C48 n=1 Tax=Phytophthora infestans (strain T30-4) TaxID=403677 RepID=D0NWD6_PHYIT|nr:uncharacterized protein PITG_17482 [Phytophthora infestans T30-4]EEY66992.1 conserved hypothetical protein [Phytophthora infestans T30-4]|eukprot:XP_002896546.1 conserved hypothetical protein [Phytophthora infestans T30-4]